MDHKRLIGDRGKLPWNRPEDLQLFRQLTEGHTVVMGRTTFASLAGPLSNRRNIILSRSLPERQDVVICRSFAEALARARQTTGPVFFIGGAQIYAKALKVADELHISWIEGEFSGDCYFPEVDFDAWRMVEERPFTGFRYVRYVRKTQARVTNDTIGREPAFSGNNL